MVKEINHWALLMGNTFKIAGNRCLEMHRNAELKHYGWVNDK